MVCYGLTVSETGKGMSWILLLLLLHAGVPTIGTGGMSWILSPMIFLYRSLSYWKGLLDIGTESAIITMISLKKQLN